MYKFLTEVSYEVTLLTVGFLVGRYLGCGREIESDLNNFWLWITCVISRL